MREVHQCVMETQLEMTAKIFLVTRMSDIEVRLAQGVPEKPQVASMVGAFQEVRGAFK